VTKWSKQEPQMYIGVRNYYAHSGTQGREI